MAKKIVLKNKKELVDVKIDKKQMRSELFHFIRHTSDIKLSALYTAMKYMVAKKPNTLTYDFDKQGYSGVSSYYTSTSKSSPDE